MKLLTLYFFIIDNASETYFRQFRHPINFTAFSSLMEFLIYVAIKGITHSRLCTNLLNAFMFFFTFVPEKWFCCLFYCVLYIEVHSLRQEILKGKVRCKIFLQNFEDFIRSLKLLSIFSLFIFHTIHQFISRCVLWRIYWLKMWCKEFIS